MIKDKPPTCCGVSQKQLVHYINGYGHRLKQPAQWNDVDKQWINERGEQVHNVVDFEPMVDDWQGGLEP